MAQFRAKFVVVGVTTHDHPSDPARGVTLRPVASGSEENKSFSKYTPSGKIDLYVTNPNLFPVLDQAQGKSFYVDFTEAE
jgi:hypothetical protein